MSDAPGAAATVEAAADAVRQETSIYKEKVKGDQNGKFNRFYVLRIWCIPFDLPCWCIHLSDLSVD